MNEERAPRADEVGASARDWLGLGLLAVPSMLVSVNSNLLNLALPVIAADLRPTGSELLWISDIYLFLVAGLLLPMGVLADRFGRRRMLLIGAAVFGGASIGAAFSPTPFALILWRGLIGIGAAMIAPSTLSLIRSMFRIPRQRAVALGVWTASFALGGILGPLIGGFLIEAVSWRAVFAVTPPAMAVLLALGPTTLPEYRSDTRRRIDVLGVALAIVGLLSTVYAIKQLTVQADTLVPMIVGVFGALLLTGFVMRLYRVADPLVDVSLVGTRAFAMPQVANALAFAVLYSTQLLLGQYLQAVLGMPAFEAGMWTIPSAVAYAVGGLLAPRMGTWLRPARVLAVSLAVSGIGFALVGAVGTDSGLVAIVAGSITYSLGLAPLYQATTALAMGAAPTDHAGVAGATLETTTNLGGALGIAVFGSLAGAAYRVGTAGTDVDTETVGDVMTTASTLAPSHADALIQTAQSAFVDGFQLVVVSGAILLLVAAALMPRLMRQ